MSHGGARASLVSPRRHLTGCELCTQTNTDTPKRICGHLPTDVHAAGKCFKPTGIRGESSDAKTKRARYATRVGRECVLIVHAGSVFYHQESVIITQQLE